MSSSTRFGVRLCVLSLFAAAVAFWAGPAHAVSAAWTGATDAGWFTAGPPTNWDSDPAAVPGTTDTATFDGTGNGNVAIDVATGGPLTIGSIAFDGAAASYTIGTGGADGQALTVDAGGAISMTAAVGNNQLIDAGITDSGLLTLGNASTSNSLTLAGTLGADFLNKTGDGLVVLSGASTVTGATTVTGGTLQYSANGSTGSIGINGGDITIDNGVTLGVTTGATSVTFNSSNAVSGTGTINWGTLSNFTIVAST